MVWNYLKTRRKESAVFALFAGIMAAIFALYKLPAAAVGYGALICCFFGAVFLAIDYRSFRRRHRELSRELSAVLEYMPQPAGLLEEDYQKIIRHLEAKGRAQAEETERNYQDLTDYYTAWVHQIKTPIAAMRLILQGEEPECARELTGELQRIEQYVEMVLCYLRLNSNSTDYVIREYDLDELLRQAVRNYAPVFIRKKIRLEYEPLHERVVTDEKWLLFVIEQILSNGLKYTETGGVISIALEMPKTLCIRDTGIGIAPEDLPRIFEKGFTGGNGRTDRKASGIGMYLCKQICDNLGHGLCVTSAPGAGTEVRLDLKNADLEVE